jgi:hypothetical protein
MWVESAKKAAAAPMEKQPPLFIGIGSPCWTSFGTCVLHHALKELHTCRCDSTIRFHSPANQERSDPDHR